jgi:hypothetical protein
MRPLLRPDAYLAESEDGAYLLTHRGPVQFTGRSVHRFIEQLAPYLDGSRTLDELTTGLTAERGEAVRKLVGMLLDRDVVRDMAPAAQAAPARPEITYLGYFDDDPVRAFERYQGMRTLVLGEGPVAAAVAQAAARSGLHNIAISSTMDDFVADQTDLVLHVPAEFSHAERLEQRHRGWHAQAVLRGGHAWLGIAGPSGAELWGSVRRRLEARHQAEAIGREPGTAAITAVAARLVHSAFRAITGLDEPQSHRLTRINLSTLEDTTHTVVPHPLALRALDAPRVALRELDVEAFSREAAACTDDVIGLLGEPSERDLAQIPLRVCEITVSDPVGLLGADTPAPVVTGAGLDFATARYRAALRAFACYASLMVDRRRVREECVPGYALESMDPVPVPVSLAFPVLDGVAEPYVLPVGVAAGFTWLEAIESGLVGHCLRLTVAEMSTKEQPARRIDLAAVPLGTPGDRYRAMLTAIGRPVTVYDITGSLGVPTFLCCLDGQPAGCASRFDALAALTNTLEQAILHYQATENGQTVYAPPPAPVLATRADPVTALPASVDLATAVQALTRLGHRPVAVPLDHDQEMSTIVPHTFRVVLLDD